MFFFGCFILDLNSWSEEFKCYGFLISLILHLGFKNRKNNQTKKNKCVFILQFYFEMRKIKEQTMHRLSTPFFFHFIFFSLVLVLFYFFCLRKSLQQMHKEGIMLKWIMQISQRLICCSAVRISSCLQHCCFNADCVFFPTLLPQFVSDQWLSVPRLWKARPV